MVLKQARPLPHTHWPCGGLPAHSNCHLSACTHHHQSEHRWDCKTRRDVWIKHFQQLGITVWQVLSDKAKRNPLLTSFLYSSNNQPFPHKILSSDNSSCCKGFILSAQLTIWLQKVRTQGKRRACSFQRDDLGVIARRAMPHTPRAPTQQNPGALLTAPSGINSLSRQHSINTYGIQICPCHCRL